MEVGVYGKPHSWFVALAEPAAQPECSPTAPRRLGLALVIPRGGLGALNAGPAAAEVIKAMYKLELFGKPEELARAAPAAAVPVPAPGATPRPPRLHPRAERGSLRHVQNRERRCGTARTRWRIVVASRGLPGAGPPNIWTREQDA